MFLMSRIASNCVNFAAETRLPMAAGWDHLLPEWFTRLHPLRRTPVNSILFVTAVTLALGLIAVAGHGRQEAFQLLQNAAMIGYALVYLAMFAIPILGYAGARWPLRVAATSGFAMTLLCVTLSVFPIVDVPNPLAFTLKITGAICVVNVAGMAVYWVATSYGRGRASHTQGSRTSRGLDVGVHGA